MSNSSGDVDKDFLHGKFQAGEDRKAALYLQGARKHLDIADDGMNIDVKKGLDWKGLAVLGVFGLGAMGLWTQRPQQPAIPPTPPAVVAPVAPTAQPIPLAKPQEFKVEFKGKDVTVNEQHP